MNCVVLSLLVEVGLVFFVIEGICWIIDDEMVLFKVKVLGLFCYLVVNKMDKVEDKEVFMVYF